MTTARAVVGDGLAAALPASLGSGLPSTIHALATGGDPLEATVAAGSLLLPRERRLPVLLAAAVPVHLAISLGWSVVLARLLPARRTTLAGALAGAGIAALDLGVAGRLFPRVRALPRVPQLVDHVAFGAIVGRVIAHRREREATQLPRRI
jgi:hypothetical protein